MNAIRIFGFCFRIVLLLGELLQPIFMVLFPKALISLCITMLLVQLQIVEYPFMDFIERKLNGESKSRVVKPVLSYGHMAALRMNFPDLFHILSRALE